MIHYGESPHPAHQGFAESVDADIIPCNPNNSAGLSSRSKEILRGAQLEYDVLISEGSRPLISVLFQGLVKDCKVLYLCADNFFYDVNFSAGLSVAKAYLANSVLKRVVDGVIAVSDFAAEFVRTAIGTSIPIRVVHPFIQQDPFEELEDVSPALDSTTTVTISSAPNGMVGQYKGVDLLVNSWSKVRDSFPGATLRVVGRGHPKIYEQQDGVIVEGYVDSLADVLEDASLYVQPSRVEPYGVTVLEAFRAGLPAVVTQTTGTRSEVRTIDPKLISVPASASLAERVNYYFNRDLSYKEQTSQLVRQRGEQYSPQRWKSAFKYEFESLVREVGQ
jgi:glycosyltransferase involved in cell wall biosynthesis